jgi:hypothetical protein
MNDLIHIFRESMGNKVFINVRMLSSWSLLLLNFEQLQRIFFFQAALLAALFQAALQAAPFPGQPRSALT